MDLAVEALVPPKRLCSILEDETGPLARKRLAEDRFDFKKMAGDEADGIGAERSLGSAIPDAN
ncbi:MAG: hypothetical protein RL479_546 [Verrucomicrobiota bacterium]|jgi:hypothetical protein